MRKAAYILFWIVFFFLINCGIPSCDFGHDSKFTNVGLITANQENLPSTTISPTLNEPILPGRNVLWCGTFQLAWNEACALIGEDLHLDADPPMVADLNRRQFTRGELDEESYVALAGFVGDGIFAKIPLALLQKFKGQATPHCLPDPKRTPRPQDFVTYAYLFKKLEFDRPFEQIDRKMAFDGGPTQVPVFGLGEYKSDHQKLYGQVHILDYRGDDDFVIELLTKARKDRLILAKFPPEKTLEATVRQVQKRITQANAIDMQTGDVLAVPKFNFDLTREYRELYQRLSVKNPKVAADIQILSAIQDIRFQMDEKGVRLRSESHISFGCGAGNPMPRHILIFNKPFLVMMQRTEAKTPYFALWVGNADLLAKQ